jgi:hypothetical protein
VIAVAIRSIAAPCTRHPVKRHIAGEYDQFTPTLEHITLMYRLG